MCKYRDSSANKARIVETFGSNSKFGHWSGKSGLAMEDSQWITQYTVDQFGTNWLLTSQQYNLYRGNAIDLTVNPNLSPSPNPLGTLTINDGDFSQCCSEVSDFACAEVIIVNQILNEEEIICIEKYFNQKYDLSLAPYEPTTSPSNAPSQSPVLPPTAGIYDNIYNFIK